MVTLSLDWLGGLRFANSEGSPAIELHSSTPGRTSPPQALAYAVMGCMAMDVVHIVEKGKHRLESMTVTFEGRRAEHPPRRFETMSIHFDLAADVAPSVIERAIALSREKYCSVWHTIRPDVELTTTFAIREPSTRE
jgi:putative redox protein